MVGRACAWLRSWPRRWKSLLCAGCLIWQFVPPAQAQDLPAVDEERVAAAGIRRLDGSALTLYTDVRNDADLERLPAEFAAALPQWEKFFGQAAPPDGGPARGCVMRDAEKFRQAGLLPEDLPPFEHGYTRGRAWWVYEQQSAYYRRHLALHEGTHWYSLQVAGDLGPAWYAEGVAELNGTHRLEGDRLQLRWFPQSRDETPLWGRILLVRKALAAGERLTLDELWALPQEAPRQLTAYGWCWAGCTFLDGHPRAHQAFRALAQLLGQNGFADRVHEAFAPLRPQLDWEWQQFLDELDYGYDLQRSAVSYAEGQPLDGPVQLDVASDRAWQSSGLRVEAGRSYAIVAQGRFQIARTTRPWPCEPGGVTIRYYAGRPLGRLLAAVVPDDAPINAAPWRAAKSIGLGATLRPAESGTLYFRLNDSPAALDDNAGAAHVTIAPGAAASEP